uniref:Clp ATPase C-terminal domain-containing protein n=1 Tax=Kalanchoe fedtschenkoi TaxID=63787 RepID=A0A7N0U3G9_KALFE
MDKSSALEYINQMFPTEASLSGVEPLMQKIQNEIRLVDAGILAAVRQQSNSGNKAKEDLAAATHAVQVQLLVCHFSLFSCTSAQYSSRVKHGETSYELAESSDLIAYGLIPEFIGRFPILVSLSALNEEQLVQVLTEPKNALGKQYKKMFSMNNVGLQFTDGALRLIAKKAIIKNTGARGLRALLENILTEAMFEVPDVERGVSKIDAVLVDEESVGSLDRPGCGAKILLEKNLHHPKKAGYKVHFLTFL